MTEAGRLVELSPDECLELLATVPVGRVAMIEGDRPVILPVNHRVVDGDVVFRTAEDGLLGRAAIYGRPVAFQGDAFDTATHRGWSVVVHGEVRQARPGDVEALAEQVHPWATGDRSVVVRIESDEVTGRRIVDAH